MTRRIPNHPEIPRTVAPNRGNAHQINQAGSQLNSKTRCVEQITGKLGSTSRQQTGKNTKEYKLPNLHDQELPASPPQVSE